MTLLEFYVMLESHDWNYIYSDSMYVFIRGDDDGLRMKEVSKQSPEHLRLYDQYTKYINAGGPKPAKPKE